MAIIEMDLKMFDSACRRLAELVVVDGCPDMIVGIRSGGAHVGRRVHKYLNGKTETIAYSEITCRRPLTTLKNELRTMRYFKKLPRFLANTIRNVESFLVSLKLSTGFKELRNVLIEPDLERWLVDQKTGSVLIVDDAVDSGQSLAQVLICLRDLNKFLVYRTAVITVTKRRPILSLDLFLYENQLIRFPWAIDYTGSDRLEQIT